MRIVAASDLHGTLPSPESVPEGDVLALAGDLCPPGGPKTQLPWLKTVFARWVERLPADHVLATWGNHDFVGQEHPAPPIPRVRWLVDTDVEIDGCRFWGSPWSLPFFDWAFMRPEEELAKTWSVMPDDTDVAIVHGPPQGYGDLTSRGQHVGSVSLRRRLEEVRPQLAVFGHIHEAAGEWNVAGGVWANVSLLDLHYRLVRRPRAFAVNGRDTNRA
jgi:Icc-related predicted phosphoesterase